MNHDVFDLHVESTLWTCKKDGNSGCRTTKARMLAD